MATYAEHIESIARAAAAMSAARAEVERLHKTEGGPPFSDAYVDARIAYSDARESYERAYAAKIGTAYPARRA